MNITHLPINFEDDRGAIRDIFQTGAPDCVTVITTKADGVRGNHFHQLSTQHAYVVSGRMYVYCRKPHHTNVERYKMQAGDLVLHEAMEEHAYLAIEDTVFLAFASGLRKGEDYEKDTYRVPSLIDAYAQQEGTKP